MIKIETGEKSMLESSSEEYGYGWISDKIKYHLKLDKSPVALKFVLREDELPEDMKRIETGVRHCEMVQKASRGEIFYATADEQTCKGGAAALGLMDAPEKVKTGEMYQSLGRFSSIGSAKRTVDQIPKIENMMYALIYAPLEKATFDPDVIVVICNSLQAMKLAQAMVYTLGGRVEADFSGIQSVCADAVAGPFTTKKPNITLGCSGSRKYADIQPDEVIVGLNGENIGCIVNALENMS